MSLSDLTHIDLQDESYLYVDSGRWIQSYSKDGGGADLGPVGDETDAAELCSRLNCAPPKATDTIKGAVNSYIDDCSGHRGEIIAAISSQGFKPHPAIDALGDDGRADAYKRLCRGDFDN